MVKCPYLKVPHYIQLVLALPYSQVTFEFRSLIYAHLGCILFDEVARTMAQAFEVRCQAMYGPDHLKSSSNSLKHVRDWLRTARTGHTHTRPCESS